MKKLIAVLLSAAMILQTAVLVFAADSAAAFNVGQHAATFAYGSEAGTKTSYAVDGKTTTAWISANTNANYKDYLVLDLGAAYSIENLKFMPAEGAAANFTVYGATSANGAKTAITDKIATLTEGEFTTVDTIDDGSYRFITLEQDAAETDFGFAEIEVNTLDAVNPEEFIAGGPSQTFAVNAGKIWYVNYPGYAQGNAHTGEGDRDRANIPNMVDADPSSAYAININNHTHTMIMLDLEEAKKVSHLVYQGRAADDINTSSGYDHIDNLLIVATNDAQAFDNQNWEVVAEVRDPATYQTGDGQYDTGLMVFDVASILGDTPYRYYGVAKTDRTSDTSVTHRLSVGTLQVYETVEAPLPIINVAKNKAAMAYGSAGGTNPAYAVDGDVTTYWESINNTTVLHDNLVIDLGANYAVDSIRVTLAGENAAKAFSVYGSKDIKEEGKTKLCDVANAAANDGQIYSAGTESYRYIIIDKAPSDKPLAFAEIEVNAPARSAGEANTVSLISEGKTVTGSTYKAMDNWDVKAEDGAKMVDNTPETRFGSSAKLEEGRFISYFLDLGDSFPISHVVYQGTDRGDFNPVNNENDSLTGYTIVGTNTAPKDFGAFNISNFTVLATKTGYPHVGDRIDSNFFGASKIYDTGLTVMPVNGSYRYIGVIRDHAEDGSTTARLNVNTLQVYAKADSVVDYVKNQGVEQIISAETGSATADSVSYRIDMLNAGESYAVTGLFANAQDATKTAYADGRIPMAGTYGSLNLTAPVTDGTTGTWDLIMLRGLKAVNYIENIAAPQKVELAQSAPSGNVDFVQSGLTGAATGKANAKLLGMMILKPGKDKDNFSAADIYYHMVKPMPKEDEEFSEDFTFKYTFKEDTEAGDYTAVFFSENGIFSDKEFTFTMHPVSEIKTAFASVTTDNFMTNVQAYPAFFGSELVSELNEANQAEGSTLAESFMMAKSGLEGGVFNGEPASWDNANTIASAVKASLIIEKTLQGEDVEDSVTKYGDAMPAVFENTDFDLDDFCDILPSVIQKATIADENDLLKEYNRTIALALIANGSLEQKEKAITNYATELVIKPETLACGYTLRALADELSTSISDCKTIYADGMDTEIQDVITELNEKKSEGGGSVTLGGNKNNVSVGVPGVGAGIPGGPVNVPVTTPEKANTFADLAGFGWAEPSINFLVSRNIIAGVGNDCFDPAGLLNREQATKLLILSLNLPTEEHKNGFKDCEYGAWYYPYITSAETRGLIKGVSKNTFGLGASVTRQDLAVMIYRAISKELPKLGETQAFADDALIADYAKDAVSALASLGIITGHDDGSFAPTKTATRAEASAIFARLINFIETYEEEVAE